MHNQITNLEWAQISGIRYLDFFDNQIESLSWVEFSNSLTHLNLSNNYIKSIKWITFPNSFLGYLYLSNNQISDIWENIIELTSLWDHWWLHIDNNHIDWTKLSSETLSFIDSKSNNANWRSTQTVTWCTDPKANNYNSYAINDTWTCRYTINSGNIVSKFLCPTNYSYCDLSDQQISSIEHDAFEKHTELQTLKLSNNYLTSLSWVKFPNTLTYFYIDNNQLENLCWIHFWNSVKNLYLSNNPLTNINNIESLNSLRYYFFVTLN